MSRAEIIPYPTAGPLFVSKSENLTQDFLVAFIVNASQFKAK